MAAESTIVPPAAPAAAPKPGAPSAFPASTGEIRVTSLTVPPGAEPTAKPETAKGRLFGALKEKAGIKAPAAAERSAQTAPKATEKSSEQTEAGAAAEPAAPTAPESEPSQPGGEPAATDPAAGKTPGKKPSPWKLVEDYKGRLAKAETELAEARKAVVPEQDRKVFEERVAKAETRVKELEQYLTYVDYSKTEEFRSKYVAPYEKAWGEAMSELKELTIVDPQSGSERPVSTQDMLALVNAPLGQARKLAQELFGDFADDVMAHRKSIRDLFSAQNAALEDAKKNGSEKLKQANEALQKQQQDLRATVSKAWQEANDSIVKDERYKMFFTPREGDEEWNKRLAKGYELADKAFSENPSNPKFTPEERAAAIRRHAAVRNRAASWGALRGENTALKTQIEELKKELEQYKGTEPGTVGGRKPAEGAPVNGNAKQRMMEELKKRAH